ncbi:MAG: hypothetical protein HZC24_10840 [Rhodocyclales bacterium]|nr:hypothetical protein [Rhodocyclales bacterium]
MSQMRGLVVLSLLGLVLLPTACTPVVAELKAARHPRAEGLHEQLSQSIRSFGFSHGIRSVREDEREIDTIFVAIPLDSLKRQHITLHHMLFNVARLCARPEFAKIAVRIELNAGDESDRSYMRGIVAPIVAEARNVQVVSQRDASNDLVITISNAVPKPAAGD